MLLAFWNPVTVAEGTPTKYKRTLIGVRDSKKYIILFGDG